jgi:hypothetical protein
MIDFLKSGKNKVNQFSVMKLKDKRLGKITNFSQLLLVLLLGKVNESFKLIITNNKN